LDELFQRAKVLPLQQNWTISQYPDNGLRQRRHEEPKGLARECIYQLDSWTAKLMGADRIFY